MGNTCKSKTFHKGSNFLELYDWFIERIEADTHQPEGTDWSGGEPGPHYPVTELNHKYIVTITKVESELTS